MSSTVAGEDPVAPPTTSAAEVRAWRGGTGELRLPRAEWRSGQDTGALVPDAGLVVVVDAGVFDAGAALDAGVLLGAGATLSVHTTLGLPSAAMVSSPTQWLLVKPQYVTAYDTTRKVPRWVSWEVSSAWLGAAARSSSFHQDAQLPAGTPQATDADYRNSGFDRGHLCASADRTATATDNLATFTLTNVVPQTHESNAGPWEALETEVRTWAAAGHHVYVVAGPIFGVTAQRIGAGVEVPLSTFKVAVVLDEGQAASASTRVVAVVVPNTQSVSGAWRPFRTTVRAVEQATGLDLLSDLPRDVQDVVETRVDAQ